MTTLFKALNVREVTKEEVNKLGELAADSIMTKEMTSSKMVLGILEALGEEDNPQNRFVAAVAFKHGISVQKMTQNVKQGMMIAKLLHQMEEQENDEPKDQERKTG